MDAKIKIACLFLLLIVADSCHNASQDVINTSPSARISATQQPTNAKLSVDESVKGDYEVRAGMLYFKDLKTYLALEAKLDKMQTGGQIAFARETGFTSAIKAYSELLLTLDKIQDKQQYDKVFMDNKTILSIRNNVVEPSFNSIHGALIDQANMVSIGKIIHCFTADATIIVKGGDINKARQAAQTLTSNDESVVVFKRNKKSSTGGRIAASCSRFDNWSESSDQKRRVRVASGLGSDYFEYTNIPPGGGKYFYVQNYSLIEGTAFKKNFWGDWVGYSTGNTLNAAYSVDISWTNIAGTPTSTSLVRSQVFSNDSHVIQDKRVFETLDQVPLYLMPLTFDPARYTAVYHESSPLGLYTSGGVPSGVELKCP